MLYDVSDRIGRRALRPKRADRRNTNGSQQSHARQHDRSQRHQAGPNIAVIGAPLFKRGMKGVYQHCSEKHLYRYLAEFDFRYFNRSKLGVEDMERMDRALKG